MKTYIYDLGPVSWSSGMPLKVWSGHCNCLYKSQSPDHTWPFKAGVLRVTVGFKMPPPQVPASKVLSGKILPTSQRLRL